MLLYLLPQKKASSCRRSMAVISEAMLLGNVDGIHLDVKTVFDREVYKS